MNYPEQLPGESFWDWCDRLPPGTPDEIDCAMARLDHLIDHGPGPLDPELLALAGECLAAMEAR